MNAQLRLVHPSQQGQGEDQRAATSTRADQSPHQDPDGAGFTLSPGQETAVRAVREWLRDPSRSQIFRLFGYAGTGKSSIARMLVRNVPGGPVYCAYTGKAALRMRQTGCDGASTIHSLIYRAVEGPSGTEFVFDPDGEASKAGIIVVDECSMVDEKLARDLMRYGKPMLVLGDPAQLPPVGGQGYLTNAEPDAMLTEIHRQALDNPILRAATLVREGGTLDHCEEGALRVLRRGVLGVEDALSFDQVLCGTHKVRRSYVRQMRKAEGHVGKFPEEGERVMCTSNDRKKGIFNGQMFTVAYSKVTPQLVKMRLYAIDGDEGDDVVQVKCLQKPFYDPSFKPTPAERHIYQTFDFGQVITVHKAQGSEWENVLVYDESRVFREDSARWLYTAITRAAERLTVVI